MKMTLIDKDKFIQDVISRKYSQASMRLIREQPEVPAIPIEWVKKWLNETEFRDRIICFDIRDMLEEWEKENDN